MKLDLLVIAAHPDDAELACSGTIALEIAKGKKVGILDLTMGEMGTRGTPELRLKEAEESAQVLGLSVRENMGFRDAFFSNDEEHQLKLIQKIRKYKPEIILTNAIRDRHPDHAKASELTVVSSFKAGLAKIETQDESGIQAPWRPNMVYHFIQSILIAPDFVVDVSDHWQTKLQSINAFRSQFYNPDSIEPETYISSPEFMKLIEARGKEFGHSIGVPYGEGFTIDRNIGIKDLWDLI